MLPVNANFFGVSWTTSKKEKNPVLAPPPGWAAAKEVERVVEKIVPVERIVNKVVEVERVVETRVFINLKGHHPSECRHPQVLIKAADPPPGTQRGSSKRKVLPAQVEFLSAATKQISVRKHQTGQKGSFERFSGLYFQWFALQTRNEDKCQCSQLPPPPSQHPLFASPPNPPVSSRSALGEKIVRVDNIREVPSGPSVLPVPRQPPSRKLRQQSLL